MKRLYPVIVNENALFSKVVYKNAVVLKSLQNISL